MFIGKIQTHLYAGSMGISAMRSNVTSALKQTALPQYDRVEIGIRSQENSYFGRYKPNFNQMSALGAIPYTQVTPDNRLQKELLPPSEQSSYTEEDALINQYIKQSRIDGNTSEPVKLILKDDITKEDLEKFKNKLVAQGLGTEIDWRGVKEDFVQIGVGFDNIERFEQKVDYLASRYAVLKERIQNQFAGDKQEAELQKLEQIFIEAKEEMADSYADSIGSFFEGLGQFGAAEDMRNSVLAFVDQKANAYTETKIEADLTEPDKQWLKQDDAYMAAQLRLRASVSSETLQKQSPNEQIPYDRKDLLFAGIYAKTLSRQLRNPTWDIKKSDAALGQHLASQYDEWKNSAEKAGISENLSNMLTSSFNPFMDRFMDSLDTLIDRNQGWVTEKPWMSGMIRTEPIDRARVYHSFQNAIS